jgi:A/G-specific adenine glycosylase
MMDLGAAICTPRRPACSLCPIAEPCVARAEGRQEAYPVRGEKADRPTRRGAAFVAVRADGAVLLRTRAETGLLGGMTEVPGTDWSAGFAPSPGDAPFPAEWQPAGTVIHVFTHFRLELNVYCARDVAMDDAADGCWWSAAGDIPGEALPSVMKKAIEMALPGATRTRRRAA